jgi:hypothetical protein
MSLVEKYVEALETLTGTPFQDAVCTRLRSAIPSFQKIPDKGGDGGLDGQRPWLLPVIQQWSNSKRDHQASLLVPQHLRRGYLADSMFDDVIDL